MSNWTSALSTGTLELIYSQTTDRVAQREVMAELDRRTDAEYHKCMSCGTGRHESELQQSLTLSWAPIVGEFVCRDRDACYEAFKVKS